ncbi:MAG: hypothetical protein ABIC04_01370 [Nanoarchaeota archaeon]
MRSMIFDTGPIISLTLNNLTWILEPLKQRFRGNFLITNAIKNELVDKPLKTKRFEFEALQTLRHINKGTLEIIDNDDIEKKTLQLLDLANNSYKAKGNYIQITHIGEMSGVAACLYLKNYTFAIDERTLRLLIEDPHKLKNILEHRLHTKVEINRTNLKRLNEITKDIRLIRSVELVTIAFELGLLDDYIPSLPDGKRILLESLLWGVKLDGCSVSKREIKEIMRIEKL